jgi:hypothetical protein
LYLNVTVLTLALPVSLYVYLMVRRVPWVLALPASLYLMIAMANLPVRPKMMHLALIVIFFSLAIFVKLGERPARWGFLLVVCAALSLIRPELLYALVAVAGWCLYLLIAERQRKLQLAGWLGAGALLIAALYWKFGVPWFGERSIFALAWHFSVNYMSWQGAAGNLAFTGDYWAIYHSVFGDAQSIPAAFIANPPAFLHHLFTNLLHAPVVLASDFLLHFNLFLPRYRLFTIAEGGLFAAVLAGGLIAYRHHSRLAAPSPAAAAGYLGAGKALISRLGAELPETFVLLLFLAPYPVMMVVLYPRHHYALVVGAIVFAFTLVVLGAGARAMTARPAMLLLLPVLLALVPSLGSVGVLINRPFGEEWAAPRTALAEALLLRDLKASGPVNVFESSDPGISPYVAPNFRSLSEMTKEHGLEEFLRAGHISVVIEDDKLRAFARCSDDPEWAKFRASPQQFGFAAKPVPGTDAVIYVKRELLN